MERRRVTDRIPLLRSVAASRPRPCDRWAGGGVATRPAGQSVEGFVHSEDGAHGALIMHLVRRRRI